jgi:hypothetical protein
MEAVKGHFAEKSYDYKLWEQPAEQLFGRGREAVLKFWRIQPFLFHPVQN